MWQLIVQCDKFTNSKLRRSQYISCNVLQPPPTSGYVQCIHKALYRTKYIIIWGHSILLFWHKRCCCSHLTFRQSTGNDMSGSLFSLFISFLLFFCCFFFSFCFLHCQWSSPNTCLNQNTFLPKLWQVPKN